jgi:hypothetical protein
VTEVGLKERCGACAGSVGGLQQAEQLAFAACIEQGQRIVPGLALWVAAGKLQCSMSCLNSLITRCQIGPGDQVEFALEVVFLFLHPFTIPPFSFTRHSVQRMTGILRMAAIAAASRR